jgi:antitoxin VapB
MGVHKIAKLFTHGGSQAVRLPREFRFEGAEVRISRDGDRVILEPLKPDWTAIWAEMDQILADAGEPFPDRLPQPPTRDVSFDE